MVSPLPIERISEDLRDKFPLLQWTEEPPRYVTGKQDLGGLLQIEIAVEICPPYGLAIKKYTWGYRLKIIRRLLPLESGVIAGSFEGEFWREVLKDGIYAYRKSLEELKILADEIYLLAGKQNG